MYEYTNDLIHSSSPYLLQHAHNPVQWQEWGAKALQQAKKEDKPIIVSIGYSSCHWCHVMERESFEDTAVAQLMNEHYICIKVDREERPDVDQIYMDAVQSMGLRGGWPLNVFLTPSQKPFYGGTYFPNQGWKQLLLQVAQAYKNNREKIDESADNFASNLQQKIGEKYQLEPAGFKINESGKSLAYEKLAEKFDSAYGGIKKAPKFPMPSVWQFLAIHSAQANDKAALQHFDFTLEAIANGGIYDHVGGGFARYSVDAEWHVPHFEKMLYDNGQLMSLYASGYKLTKKQKFKRTLLETAAFLKREMMDDNGGFYSALDADSEGEEGKFYVWDEKEIRQLLSEDHYEVIAAYYDVREKGNWEGKNVLRVVQTEAQIQSTFSLDEKGFHEIINTFKKKALHERSKRVRPGLDDKIIAGWNGLALSGLCNAYMAINDPLLKQLADKNATFIRKELLDEKGLKRFPNKDLEGFLEDYAAVIQAFINYYEMTSDPQYLLSAQKLMHHVMESFYDTTENLFYFSSHNSEQLIAHQKELFDNVVPSSNSMMAWNLIHLGTHFYNDQWIDKGKAILGQVTGFVKEEPEYMSNWGVLAWELSAPFAEIVIVGEDHELLRQQFNQLYLPGKIISTSKGDTDLKIFENKIPIDNQTTIYVCFDKSCNLPVFTVENALKQIL